MALGPFSPAVSGSRGPLRSAVIGPFRSGCTPHHKSTSSRSHPWIPVSTLKNKAVSSKHVPHATRTRWEGMLWFRRCCCMHKVNCFGLVLLLHDKTYTIFPPAWSHMYVSQTWTTKLNLCAITNCFQFIRENLFSEVWRYFVHFPHCFCLEMRMFRYILFVFMLLLLK